MKKFTIALLALLTVAGSFAYAQRITMTLAGTGAAGFTGDGQSAKLSKLNGPNDICMDAARNIYFADFANNVVRKISATNGVITTIAGGGTSSADGVPAVTALVSSPRYLCIDATGNIYVATGNQVRRIDMSTGLIYTVAGTGTGGFAGDGGPATAAELWSVEGICIDHLNNIYIVDQGNRRIRKVDGTTHIITTIAGSGGSGHTGDGGLALSATMSASYAIAVNNTTGDVYFSDQGGVYLRKITVATGIITNYAGNGGGVADAHGQPATTAALGEVYGLQIDPAGDVYCCDGSCSITEIDVVTQLIYLRAGSLSTDSYNGDGRNSIGTYFMWPGGIWLDGQGNIFVADNGNNRIRKVIDLTNTPTFVYGKGQFIYPCSSTIMPIDSNLTITDLDSAQTETWTVLSTPVHGTLSGFPASASSLGTFSVVKPSGVYYTPATGYEGLDSFRVQVSDGALSDVMTIYVTSGAGAITGPSTVCTSTTITLTDPIQGGAWSTTNADATVAAGIVAGVTPGIDTIIYTLNNVVCGVETTNKIITVSADAPPTPGTITGPGNVCAGATITLTDGVTGGVWSASNTDLTISPTGVVTGVSAGLTDIYYTVTNACGSVMATAPINILPLPVSGTISGASGICKHQASVLTDAAPGGVWSADNTNVFISTTGVVTGLVIGSANAYYTVTNTCGTSVATLPIIVNDCHSVGVTPVNNMPAINIFPNPASSVLNIEGTAIQGNVNVTITDVSGRLVLSTELANGQVNISELKDGIYLVAITTSTEHFTDKLVVSK